MTAQVPRALADAIARNGSHPLRPVRRPRPLRRPRRVLRLGRRGRSGSGRLHHQPRGGAAVRRGRRPLDRRAVAGDRPSPIPSWWSRRAPDAAPSPSRCWPRRRLRGRRCATSWSSGRPPGVPAQGEHLALVHPFEVLGPDGDARRVGAGRRRRRADRCSARSPTCRSSASTASSSPTNCSTTSRSACPSEPSTAGRSSGSDWTTPGPHGSDVPLAPGGWPITMLDRLARRATDGCRRAAPGRCGRLGRPGPVVLRRGSVLVIDYADPRRPWPAARSRNGSAPTADTSAERIRCSRSGPPGHHLRGRDRSAPRRLRRRRPRQAGCPVGDRRAGRRGPARGPSGPGSGTSRRCGRGAGSSKPRP